MKNNNDTSGNDDTRKRVEKLGQYASQSLITALIAQCYSFIRARTGDVSVQQFKDVFNYITTSEPIGFIVYDDDDQHFWTVKIPEVENMTIVERNQSDLSRLYVFPEYAIGLRFRVIIKQQGTAEDLYAITDQEVMDLFQRGWDTFIGSGVKPVGMLTPHDLCSYVNFMETTSRLINFILYVLSSSDIQSGLMVPGYIVTDRWTIMSMELLISMATSAISQYIRQPTDMLPLKTYVTRTAVVFHECKFDESAFPPFLKAYMQGCGIKTEDIRLIPMNTRPEIKLALFTSVIQQMPRR